MWQKIHVLCFVLITQLVCAQYDYNTPSKKRNIQLEVIEKETNKAITNAEVSVNGSYFYVSPVKDRYEIKARIGDELTVRHPDFETVYYTIRSGDNIRIEVEKPYEKLTQKIKRKRSSFNKKKISKPDFYNQYLDSVRFYEKKDIEKSIGFVSKMLKSNLTKSRKANVYEVLANVYFYWKQYDLAVENYQASLKEKNEPIVRLQLAKAQYLDGQYKESEKSYLRCRKQKLTLYESMSLFEGLGDVYKSLNQLSKAELNYKSALIIAENNQIEAKVTDLNSKLADLYAKSGEIKKADSLYQNSLQLANQENVGKSLKQETKVADYFNTSRRFDEEIELRKESLKKANEITIETDDKESLVDSITSQKINYKIGYAYMLKEDYPNAIEYLEKSAKEAAKKEDLEVQKHAVRKLSEVYAKIGDNVKAMDSYREFVSVVDSLYIRKEQEIYQVKRLTKKIADNQNRIASLEKDKELSESKINLAYKDQQLVQESNTRQEIIIYSLLASIFLIVLLVYFMYKNIRQQKLANNLLALKSMRSQMNPHFIFNALNSVNSFIAVNDERSANRYLSEFSALMRSVLENSDEDFIPLSKEIELLQLYVKLEHNRFQDKFDYTIMVDEKIPLEAYSIPPMLLQPYIENAIWHGLRYKKEKGKLQITMNQINEQEISICIEDDGVGRKKSMEMKTKNQLKQKSKGMSTIKNRIDILNDMYQDKVTVNVTDAIADGSGTKVVLQLKRD
ncbi:Tetratricopeptide repeat-containing protein [Tenacibaculum sp. 190524A02b]|uniref:tetratricopeptide repeat-containing sensor histidine kinase n=1 Tax=Tenacibaculum vairaonense TaxID=3137860 RepID=UPI0032B17F9B